MSLPDSERSEVGLERDVADFEKACTPARAILHPPNKQTLRAYSKPGPVLKAGEDASDSKLLSDQGITGGYKATWEILKSGSAWGAMTTLWEGQTRLPRGMLGV